MAPVSRRRFLAAGAAGAVGLMLDPIRALSTTVPFAQPGFLAELITVTDRGFAAWWPTATAADTTLRIARADGGRVREYRLERDRTVHVAALDNLKPDTKYRYELWSGGQKMDRSPENPELFRTLARPQGKRLATIAVLNDMHVGERCSGTITSLNGESYPPCFEGGDYAFRMTQAAIAEIRARDDVDFVLGNGDLTDRGRPGDITRSLDLFRTLQVPWRVTRGNHDRIFEGRDELRDQAFPEQSKDEHALHWVERVGKRVGIVALDSCDPNTGDGRLDLENQLAYLDATLTQLRTEGRNAIVAFHHHITPQANSTHPPPLVFGVRLDEGGEQCLEVLSRHAHVRLVLHGHTHRNYLTYDALSGPRLPFLENGATKEYPGGYAIVRVYEDAIVRTFHRMTDDFCRQWVQTSAGQIYGMQPQYTRGSLASRAFVHHFDATLPEPLPSIYGPINLPQR
ncbi:MAG: 3,5-cyclic-AMP phosphodiesterase [Thermoleophilaceae bacterium]|jgi:predicted phosphodiesterase|nr:3,5-cyclic-AMP phosphodiesterase [Thermoleophilaceae bacterium]